MDSLVNGLDFEREHAQSRGTDFLLIRRAREEELAATNNFSILANQYFCLDGAKLPLGQCWLRFVVCDVPRRVFFRSSVRR